MLQRLNAELQRQHVRRAEHSVTHFLDNALKAKFLFHKDDQYIVNAESEIVIVDEFTGRLMPGRRYSEGLHPVDRPKKASTCSAKTSRWRASPSRTTPHVRQAGRHDGYRGPSAKSFRRSTTSTSWWCPRIAR